MSSNGNVVLSAIIPSDKELLFDWINDANLVRFNAPFRPISWQSHTTWFENIGKDSSHIIFAIRGKNDSRLLGTIQLASIHPIHRSAELIIRIGNSNEQNNGYGTEAVALLLAYAWNDLNLNRIYLHVFSDNNRAISVYKKNGFEQEGYLKKAAFINGDWKDVILMACLRPL